MHLVLLQELQPACGPFPCHSASSTFAKRALAGPQILTTILMCYPAARVLHTQPGTTLDRQGYLLLCEGGTAAVLRLKSSAPLAQLVTTSICMNLYVLSHISPPTDIQNNKSHVFLPNKVSSLPLALQQDCLYAVWQALPTEKGPDQACRLLNGMVMLRVSTIKAK